MLIIDSHTFFWPGRDCTERSRHCPTQLTGTPSTGNRFYAIEIKITIRRRTYENQIEPGAGSRVIHSGHGCRQASDSARHEAQSIEKAKISLTEAIHIAEKQGNARRRAPSTSSRMAMRPTNEVKVLRNDGQKLTKYELSPAREP